MTRDLRGLLSNPLGVSRLTRGLIWILVLWVASLFFGPVSPGLRAAEEPARRIVAVGDVHGSADAFLGILRAAELVNETGAWIGGDSILVQTGDLTDRGPEVRQVLDFMRRLEQSAAESGGRVVSLLGNHEVLNLIGYYDYQSTPVPVFTEIASAFATDDSEKTRKKAYKRWNQWAKKYPGCAIASKAEWMALYPIGFVEYQEALSPRGEYGRWLRERPVVANVQDTVFLHGGLSPELLEMELTSLDSINAAATRDLAQFDRDRELLEKKGVIVPTSTLGEMHCALAYELQVPEPDELSESTTFRRQELLEIRNRLPGSEGWLLLDPRGPVWFRGYATWSDEQAEDGLATVFETFGGRRVVVGHTPQLGNIVVRFDERIFLIDTAMAYPELEGGAAALEIRGDEISAIYESKRVSLTGPIPADSADPAGTNDETVAPVELRNGHAGDIGDTDVAVLEGTNGDSDEHASASASGTNGQDTAAAEPPEVGETLSAERGWLAQDGSPLPFTDEAVLLDFLRNARVLEKKTVGKGITRPQRLVLERDGIRARAVFHTINETRRPYRSRKGPVMAVFRDSYRNNVAAYELGLLLGLTNLPPTTIRKVGRTSGSVQLWIENATDEAERREQGGDRVRSIHVRRRIADMWVFDNLINNIDRNQGNMLHDSRGGFWWIDHTRSFGSSNRLPNTERMRRCSRSLLEAIRNLEEEATSERLRPYLSPVEIKSLFVRRKKLLEYLDEQIASRGENSVLFSYQDVVDAVAVSYQADEVPASPDDG